MYSLLLRVRWRPPNLAKVCHGDVLLLAVCHVLSAGAMEVPQTDVHAGVSARE